MELTARKSPTGDAFPGLIVSRSRTPIVRPIFWPWKIFPAMLMRALTEIFTLMMSRVPHKSVRATETGPSAWALRPSCLLWCAHNLPHLWLTNTLELDHIPHGRLRFFLDEVLLSQEKMVCLLYLTNIEENEGNEVAARSCGQQSSP